MYCIFGCLHYILYLAVYLLQAESNTLRCLQSSCKMVSHTLCLSKKFLSPNSTKLLPIEGTCPCCHSNLLWGDLIRYKMGCYQETQEVRKMWFTCWNVPFVKVSGIYFLYFLIFPLYMYFTWAFSWFGLFFVWPLYFEIIGKIKVHTTRHVTQVQVENRKIRETKIPITHTKGLQHLFQKLCIFIHIIFVSW